MVMGGMRLLFGVDLLTTLGTRIKEGCTPDITLGQELPVCMLTFKNDRCFLSATEKCVIPPRATMAVPVRIQVTYPSTQLLSEKHCSQ